MIESLSGERVLFGFSFPVLTGDYKLVFAGFIGEPGDLLSVGRPAGIAFIYAGRIGQVPRISFFSRNGQDIASCFKKSTGAAGGEICIMDILRSGNITRTDIRQIRRNTDMKLL